MISDPPLDLHAGDEVEAVGLLSRIRGPANPGEADANAPQPFCQAELFLCVNVV